MTKKIEKVKIKGLATFVLKDKDGNVKTIRKVYNLITDAGFDFVCDVMGDTGSPPGVMDFIAIGTGTTAEASTDTQLETHLVRKPTVYAHTAGEQSFESKATFTAGQGTGNITESGLFNDSTEGSMLCRKTFTSIPKGAQDTLEVTWNVTLS